MFGRLAVLAVLLCSTAFVAYAQQDIKKLLAEDSAVGTYVFDKQAFAAATDKGTTGVWLMKKNKHSKHSTHSDDDEYKPKKEDKSEYKGDDSDYEQKHSKSRYEPKEKEEPKKYEAEEEPHKYEPKEEKKTHKYPPKEEEPKYDDKYEPKQPKQPHAYEPKGDEPHNYKPEGPEHYGPGPKYGGPSPKYGGPGPKYNYKSEEYYGPGPKYGGPGPSYGPGPKQYRRHGPAYRPYRPEYPPQAPEYPHEEEEYGYGGEAEKLCLQEISRNPAGSFAIDGNWAFTTTFGCCSEYADQVTPVANCSWTATDLPMPSDLAAQVGTVAGTCKFTARGICVPEKFPLNTEFSLSNKPNTTYWLSVDAALQNGTYPYGAYAAAVGDKNSKASTSAAEPKAAQPVYSSEGEYGEYEYVPTGYPVEALRGKASVFNAMIASKAGLLKGGTLEYIAGFVDDNGNILCPEGATPISVLTVEVAPGVLPMVKCGELKLKLWLAPKEGPYTGYDGMYQNPPHYYDSYEGPYEVPYWEQEVPYYQEGPEYYQQREEYYRP